MLNLIIIIGIFASTFLSGVFLAPFLAPITDTREAKEYIAFLAATLIAYLGLRQGTSKCQNQWPLIFLFYTILTINMHPPFRLILWSHDINGFWMFPVILTMTVYYLMFHAISNAEMKDIDIKKIFAAIFACGCGNAFYVIIQALQWDQLFTLRPQTVILGTAQAHLTGFMGEHTGAAVLIALTIPFGFYFRRYLFMSIMFIAVALIQCKMPIFAACTGLIFYGLLQCKNANYVVWTILGLVLIGIGTAGVLIHSKKEIPNNGRFAHWEAVVKDLDKPQIVDIVPEDGQPVIKEEIEVNNRHQWSLTGIGPGAYQFIYVNKYNSPWAYIHNEYLEVMYGWGRIGLLLFVIMVFSIIGRGIYYAEDTVMIVLTASALVIALCASTNFIWQVEPIRFLSVLIAGLICNPNLRGEYVRSPVC